MKFLKKIRHALKRDSRSPERIRISRENIENWPSFSKRLKEGNLKFDRHGRLRYLHGAPVGDLILVKKDEMGTSKYKELAEEWFDPVSEKAENFKWDD